MESLRRDSKVSAQDAWDKRSRDWRSEGQPHSFFTNFVEAHRAELGKDVIDIGCGNGIYLVPLAKQGFNVTGVDFSGTMLQRAKENLEKNGLSGNVLLGQAATKQLPFSTESFDFGISLGVFHFNSWDDIQRSFAEAARVLRPGKYFMLQVRSVNDTDRPRTKIADTPAGFIAVDKEGRLRGVEQHYFTKEGLEGLGKKNGFEIVEGPTENQPQELGKARDNQVRWWTVFRKSEKQETTENGQI